jgi:hypothetical protein
VTAAAHKLARLIYAMLTEGEEYTDRGQAYYEERYRQRVSPTSIAEPNNWGCRSCRSRNRPKKALHHQLLGSSFLRAFQARCRARRRRRNIDALQSERQRRDDRHTNGASCSEPV